jgi:WD40 repeat protein
MIWPGFILALDFDRDGESVLILSYHNKNSLASWNYRKDVRYVAPGEWHRAVYATLPTIGDVIIASGTDGSIVIWDKTFSKRLRTLSIHCGRSPILSFLSRNHRLAVYGQSGVIWDLISDKKICDFNSGIMNTVSSICLSSDGNLVVLSGCVWAYEPGCIALIDANTGRVFRNLRAHQSIAFSSSISPDKSILATGGGNDHSIMIWSLPDLLNEIDK